VDALERKKICSIGIACRRWVTFHGLALNVTTDLGYFDLMVPCGIADVVMTSVERELLERADGTCQAPSPTLGDDMRATIVRSFGEVFERAPRGTTLAALGPALEEGT